LSSRTTNLNRCLLLCSGAAPLLAAAPAPSSRAQAGAVPPQSPGRVAGFRLAPPAG